MSKTRLTEGKRATIIDYMMERYDERNSDRESARLFKQVVSKTNAAIRKKYPEDDMIVIRRYKLSRIDHCIRFVAPDGRVFAVDVQYGSDESKQLADLPSGRGCTGQDVFSATEAFAFLVDSWKAAKDAEQAERQAALQDYTAFVRSCRYAEDCEELITFTPEMRDKLGASVGALVPLNDQAIARVRADFAQATA